MEAKLAQQVDNLLDVKRYDDAVKLCVQSLASDPESFLLQGLLVRCHFLREDIIEADRACIQFIKTYPDSAYPYFLKSLIARQAKRFDLELEMAETAVKLDPDDADYYHRLAGAQMQSGMMKKAAQSADIAVQLEPESCESLVLLADISMELENYKKAEPLYRSTLAVEPESLHVLNNLAICLVGLKREREAIDLLFSALKRDSTDETLQDNTFSFVKRYLDRQTFKGKRKHALEELPMPIKVFYQDYKKRTSIFERYSNYAMLAFWVVVIVVIGGVSSLLE